MDKKYHVFISSTYTDLQEERREALQALLGMGYIVSGMEYFPAVDLDQFEYIKKQIDDCDYYLLIVAGKYGTISPSGISYTELEYNYAVEKGIPIVALLHKNIESIPSGFCESSIISREKLHIFRNNVCTGRMVKFWNSKDEIGKHVLSAMVAATNFFHPVGWVRSNRIANDDALNEIITLKKENERLKQKLKKLEKQVSATYENLAPLESEFMINGEGEMLTPDNYERTRRAFSIVKSWESIFKHLAQQLRSQKDYSDIKHLIQKMVRDDVKKNLLKNIAPLND